MNLKKQWITLRAEAEELAGDLSDLTRRAMVYRQVYRLSGGRHVFPLIAAHGAVWAGRHFRQGRLIARCLNWLMPASGARRTDRLQQVDRFMDQLRTINRNVCIDTWVSFHMTSRFGTGPEVQEFVTPEVCQSLAGMHDAIRHGRPMTDEEKRDLFMAHFRNEQKNIVGPAVKQAFDELDWPVVKAIARRPAIRFAYFPGLQTLRFRDFANQEERCTRGVQAFEIARQIGWIQVEQQLNSAGQLPAGWFPNPALTT